jgi:hypothetical protein
MGDMGCRGRDRMVVRFTTVYSITFSIQSCRSCYNAPLHLCQCSFYKIFVKFRNSNKNVLKIVLIIVNINKDENKSLDFPHHFLENYFVEVKIKKLKTITNHFPFSSE